MRPQARRKDLLVEKVGDELVIYDLERQRLHQLNRAAALVWQSCDGRKTVPELKKVLQNELNAAADETVVWKALDRLGKAHLLKEPVKQSASMTRRQVQCTDPICLFAFCADQCNGNYGCGTCTKPCTPDLPSCQLLTCAGPNSQFCFGTNAPCMQRRCAKMASPSDLGRVGFFRL